MLKEAAYDSDPAEICTWIPSLIVDGEQMARSLRELCGLSSLASFCFKLLYRATRDGFSAAAFHARCDHKARTLSVIRSTRGHIFGGYASVAWDHSGAHKSDANLYVFSLVNEHARPVLVRSKTNTLAIFCYKNCGPTFRHAGSKHNVIYVSDNCHRNAWSCSNFSSASCDASVFDRHGEPILEQQTYFQASEIEVFQLG